MVRHRPPLTPPLTGKKKEKRRKESVTYGASLFIFRMETTRSALSQPWLKIQGHVLNATRFDTHVQEKDLKFMYPIEDHLFLQSFSGDREVWEMGRLCVQCSSRCIAKVDGLYSSYRSWRKGGVLRVSIFIFVKFLLFIRCWFSLKNKIFIDHVSTCTLLPNLLGRPLKREWPNVASPSKFTPPYCVCFKGQ